MEGGSSSSSSDRYAERCALAAELARVLDTVRQLEAHMGGPADDGGERCRALVSSMRSSVDRSIRIAMSCCVVTGAPESPPSADGSPRSGGGLDDHAADVSRCRAANAGGQSKKRKTLPRWSTQVRVNSVQDVTPLEDRFSWRKYGQKDILGAKYPRAYFRCTHRHTQSCSASKQVQRTDGDPLLFDVVYHGNHTCALATATHCGTIQSPRLAENWQPQPAGQVQEQSPSPMVSVAVEFNGTEGDAPQGLLEPAPFSFPSKPEPAAGAHAASNDFPEWTECHVSGAKNVPDVELTSSSANSPIGDMEFMLQLAEADFLDNSRYF